MTTAATGELARLTTLVQAGLASPQELERYRQLTTIGPAAPAASATGTAPQPDDRDEFIPCNTESFKRGGQSFVSPTQEGVYPGVFTGTMRPDALTQQDQLWFLFDSAPGTQAWHGALVTAALTTPSQGGQYGAFKVKEVLDALDIPYNIVEGRGVTVVGGIKRYVGRECQVSWESVDVRGKRELRIQRVLGAKTAPVQHAV